MLHEALSKCRILSLRWISPSAEAERRAVNYRETSAESMGQVFHKPNDPGAPGEEGAARAPYRDTCYSICAKFQLCLISWGSRKIVTQRKGPNRKELAENASPLAATMAVPGVSSSSVEQPALPPPPSASSINTQGLLRRLERNRAKDNRVSFVMRKDYGIK